MAATILAGIGAAGALAGAAGGIMGANSQAKAAKQANNIAMLQYLEQRRQAQVAEEEGRAATARSLEGSTDARGNRVVYIPGRGWVTQLTDATRAQLAASDAEEYQRNTTDAAGSRAVRAAAIARQGREGNVADTVLAQRGLGGRTQEGVQSALLASKAARALASNRAMRRNINMMALRQGSGGETALAELGRAGAEDTQSAIADARLEAAPQFVAENAARENANNQSYNMFAQRATNPVDAAFRPTAVGADATAALEGARVGGGQASAALQQALANGMRVQAPQRQFAEDRTPTAIAGLGSAFMSAGNLYNAYQKRNASNNTFESPSQTAGMQQLKYAEQSPF